MDELGYGTSVLDFAEGQRVELHPGTDLWMRGATHGNVSRVQLKPPKIWVKLDRLRKPVRVLPENLKMV